MSDENDIKDDEIERGYTFIKIKVPVEKRLDFLIRLGQDDLSQREFFYLMMADYIHSRKPMRELVDRYRLSRGKTTKEEINFKREMFRKAAESENVFSEEELSDIFSILENKDF